MGTPSCLCCAFWFLWRGQLCSNLPICLTTVSYEELARQRLKPLRLRAKSSSLRCLSWGICHSEDWLCTWLLSLCFPIQKNLVFHRDGSGSFVPEGMCRWTAIAFLLRFPSKEPRKHAGLMLCNGSYYDFLCGEFCEQWDARHLADRNYS